MATQREARRHDAFIKQQGKKKKTTKKANKALAHSVSRSHALEGLIFEFNRVSLPHTPTAEGRVHAEMKDRNTNAAPSSYKNILWQSCDRNVVFKSGQDDLYSTARQLRHTSNTRGRRKCQPTQSFPEYQACMSKTFKKKKTYSGTKLQLK